MVFLTASILYKHSVFRDELFSFSFYNLILQQKEDILLFSNNKNIHFPFNLIIKYVMSTI